MGKEAACYKALFATENKTSSALTRQEDTDSVHPAAQIWTLEVVKICVI